MTRKTRLPRLRRAAMSMAMCALLGGSVTSCQDRPVCPVVPRTTSTVSERLAVSSIDKVDVLLAIDNSTSMSDKQALLALAVPDLISGSRSSAIAGR